MKSINKIILASLIGALVGGCSNEKSNIESAFMDACVSNSGNKAGCACSMDKLEAKYPGDQFVALNKAPTHEFMQDALRAAVACRSPA